MSSIRIVIVKNIEIYITLKTERLVLGTHRRLVSTSRRVNVADQRTARRTIYGQKRAVRMDIPSPSYGTAVRCSFTAKVVEDFKYKSLEII